MKHKAIKSSDTARPQRAAARLISLLRSLFGFSTPDNHAETEQQQPATHPPRASKVVRATRFDALEGTAGHQQRTAGTEIIHRLAAPPEEATIELSREECFCAVLDILFEGMSQADQVSKEAAKHLMLVMENEVGNSVSLLVYNSYVRMYNSLRQEYFASTASSLKAKTIKISTDIIEKLEQMSKTARLVLPPEIKMPRRSS